MKTILYYCLTLLLCISICNDAEAKKKKYPNGDVYEGEWKSGQPEGRGKMVYANGVIYEGNWVSGKRYGKGKMIYPNGDVYEGEWKNGKDSQGKMVYASGTIYEGEWKNDQPNGQGKITYANGGTYQGEWIMGKFFGIGKMVYANGDIYEGMWKNNKPEGKGQITYANGDKYECEWKNGEIRLLIHPNVNNISEFFGVKNDNGTMSGEVKYSYSNDNCSYKGDLKEYKRHGEGTFCFDDYSPNACIFGIWENDSLVSGSGDFVILGNTVHITKEENRPFNFNINIINNNKVVFVKDVNVYNMVTMEQFYNVVYEEVKKAEVNRFDELEHQAEKKERLKREEKEKKEKQEQEEKELRRQELIKKYGVKFAKAIVEKKIIVGMTKEMVSEVRSNWSSKHKDSRAEGIVEQWDYYGYFGNLKVIFVNGRVTRVLETEE